MKREKVTMFVLFLLAAALVATPVAGLLADGTETQVTTNMSSQTFPAIWGDRIVWRDERNGGGEIYLYNISTGTETRVTEDTEVENWWPAIWGDRIVWTNVWTNFYGDYLDLILYNISTGEETLVRSGLGYSLSPSTNPAIWDDNIVWREFNQVQGVNDIYLYNVSTLTRTPLEIEDSPYSPAIWGDRVVWRDKSDDGSIYLYNISTGIETQVTTDLADPNPLAYPAIWGDRIVWRDGDDNADIYLYDISTGAETQVTTDAGNQIYPAIWGDWIVWWDDRNGNADIYLYDISTGAEMQVTTDKGNQIYPGIWGNRIVWCDDRNDNEDIYMFEIDTAPVITSMTVPTDPQPLGSTINVIGTFTDADMDESHTATWNWGDETSSAGVVEEESGVVTGSHTYASAGIYTLSLTVTDEDDISDTAFSNNYIVVYDSNGGFVTGGGWFTSLPGAYQENEALTGEASFGFVSRLNKKTLEPEGQTDFVFDAADLHFHSSSYKGLAIANHMAKFLGQGKINDLPDSHGNEYKFMVWAGDGNLANPAEHDTFRIKIWEECEGEEFVVYDNGFDQEIEGGQIVIHIKNK